MSLNIVSRAEIRVVAPLRSAVTEKKIIIFPVSVGASVGSGLLCRRWRNGFKGSNRYVRLVFCFSCAIIVVWCVFQAHTWCRMARKWMQGGTTAHLTLRSHDFFEFGSGRNIDEGYTLLPAEGTHVSRYNRMAAYGETVASRNRKRDKASRAKAGRNVQAHAAATTQRGYGRTVAPPAKKDGAKARPRRYVSPQRLRRQFHKRMQHSGLPNAIDVTRSYPSNSRYSREKEIRG